MSAYAYALLAVICVALKQILLRSTMKAGIREWPILVFNNIAAALILMAFLGAPSFAKYSSMDTFLVFLSAAIWVVFSLCEWKSHKYLDASVGALFSALSFVLLVLGGVFIFNESISITAMLGAGLIVASTLRGVDSSGVKMNKGVRLKLISIFILAGNLLLSKYLTQRVDSEVIAIIAFLIPGFIFALIRPKSMLWMIPEVRKSQYLLLALPFITACNYFCTVKALALGDVSTTYSILQTSVLVVFIFGAVLLREKEQMAQRGLSCALSAVGAFIICNY